MEIEQKIFSESQCKNEHRMLFKKVATLGRNLMHRLGPDSLLFLEYETSVGMLNNFYMRSAYEIGFEDGKKLVQLHESCPTKCLTKT